MSGCDRFVLLQGGRAVRREQVRELDRRLLDLLLQYPTDVRIEAMSRCGRARRPIALPRDGLSALLDACQPARSPEASEVYEMLLGVELASAPITIVVSGAAAPARRRRVAS